jgi:hypothetical protein
VPPPFSAKATPFEVKPREEIKSSDLSISRALLVVKRRHETESAGFEFVEASLGFTS